jgi:hypothetical protein
LWIDESNWPRALNSTLWINGGVQLKSILWEDWCENFAQALDTLNPTRRAAIG